MKAPAPTVKADLTIMTLPKADRLILSKLSIIMHLIEEDDRRNHNMPIVKEIAAVTPVEYSDRSFRNIVRTLIGNNKSSSNTVFEQHFQGISQAHAAYVYTNCVLIFHHGAYGHH